ncbi:hypothetical protein Mkiyose1384_24500 [Mycobacterium kiyosense]|uniref:Uncharacterized protein n=1 Tax=Mycobacterium kiyosense TaxID=2871094 RepID=A0A9P3UYS8_9MYCO|nr:hypothetical protein IWGMT90018_09280 [Mycobacterium kiyosense]GLB84115.1 hypothetical protein SRL2020028_33710 [Mycobacterium kiyosense]GLB88538.1 hypothetical protein SRL2020130_13550 [Mycobacterium kiyosense]GLB94833.1 hypothetical protein SRL2020226_16090 [Mycobacterium kiyosense]GLC01995.1 hypothetical protein SRL2020400_25860 [Mycobacterium kiyosense]
MKPPDAQPGSTKIPTSTPAANSVAPPPPHISPLAKDWKTYGGTVYFGCPTDFTASKSALDDIRPKVLDPNTADLIMPAIPAIAPGETVTGAICALSNNVTDMKVVYLVNTLKPAEGPQPQVTKTTAYVVDLKSSQPLATRELQPPADLRLAAPKEWRLAPTTTGVAWLHPYTDAGGAATQPKTVVLSNTDLSTLWDDAQPGRIWQDILAFQRSTEPSPLPSTQVGNALGAELRLPTGEPVFQDNGVISVDSELSDGPDRFVQITHRDSESPSVTSTMFFDLASRSVLKLGDTDRISGGSLAATLSDGNLFVDGRGSDTSQFGYGVWNLRTQHWDLLVSRDDAKKQPITKLAFFGGHLYITKSDGSFSVLALPATNPVATNWTDRPFGRITDWTLVCRGETAPEQKGDCREILLARDTDGHYPGPWF